MAGYTDSSGRYFPPTDPYGMCAPPGKIKLNYANRPADQYSVDQYSVFSPALTY